MDNKFVRKNTLLIKKSLKNILIFTHAGGSTKYGPNIRWYNFALALRTYDIKTTIISSSYFHKYINQPKIEKNVTKEIINNIDYLWIKTSKYKKRGYQQVFNQFEFTIKSFLTILKVKDIKPKVIVASSPHPFVIFPAFIFAKVFSAKLIYDTRDLWPQVLLELGVINKINPFYWVLKFVEHFAVINSDMVFSVKEGEYSYYKKNYKLKPSKFYYLPNGFMPDEQIKKSKSSFIRELIYELKSKNKFILTYAGALSRYYNIESLLELAINIKKYKLNVLIIIVGGGDLLKSFKNKVISANLSNIRILGKINKSDVHQILEISSAGFVSLQNLDIHKYGISCNKIYEYMYCHLPILGHYETKYDPVKESNCGLVSHPGDSVKLLKDLTLLINNPLLCKEMGERGYEYFLSNHNIENISKKLLKIIN